MSISRLLKFLHSSLSKQVNSFQNSSKLLASVCLTSWYCIFGTKIELVKAIIQRSLICQCLGFNIYNGKSIRNKINYPQGQICCPKFQNHVLTHDKTLPCFIFNYWPFRHLQFFLFNKKIVYQNWILNFQIFY